MMTKIKVPFQYVRHHVGFLMDDYNLSDEVELWLQENCTGKYTFSWSRGDELLFENDSDAMLFKLVWGGE